MPSGGLLPAPSAPREPSGDLRVPLGTPPKVCLCPPEVVGRAFDLDLREPYCGLWVPLGIPAEVCLCPPETAGHTFGLGPRGAPLVLCPSC